MKTQIVLLLLVIFLLIGCADSTDPKGVNDNNHVSLVDDSICSSNLPTDVSSGVPTVYELAALEQCSKEIPAGYENVNFCKENSDCAVQYNGCGHIPINKYNVVENYVKKVGDSTGYYPHCRTENLPSELLVGFCDNSACNLKTACSNCDKVNEWFEKYGCDDPYMTVQNSCEKLIECDC